MSRGYATAPHSSHVASTGSSATHRPAASSSEERHPISAPALAGAGSRANSTATKPTSTSAAQ